MNPVDAYAKAVSRGDITACKWVRLACKRHLALYKDKRFEFDAKELDRVIDFFRELLILEHGQPYELPDWQLFIAGCLLCWKWKGTGYRLYNQAYIEVARKNAKSTFISGIGLYLFVFSPLDSAQFYSVASDREQASLLKNYAEGFIRRCPDLAEEISIRVHHMENIQTRAKWKASHADSRRLDGLNPYFASFDEFHAQEDDRLDDVINSAFGSQPEYLYIKITTAGEYKREKPCVKLNEYSKRILAKEDGFERENFFCIIYTLDEGDDWTDERNWIKANPNLGISKRIEYMRDLCETAKQLPSKQSDFLTKQLDVWVEAMTVWITKDLWDSNAGEIREEDLHGLRCFSGLDLARTNDLSALVHLFPPQEWLTKWTVLCRFWCPGDDIRDRSKRDRVPYDIWRNSGYITATDGNCTDYSFISARVIEDSQKFEMQELAFDRYFSEGLLEPLANAGIELVPFAQGFPSMGPPCSELERLLLKHDINHGNNPILTWCVSNTLVLVDPAGNIKPDKKRSNERIDGVVALVMALGRAMENTTRESVYEERDIRVL